MRVVQTSRSGKPKRPSLRNTFQKKVETGRNNNVPKGSQQMVYSQPKPEKSDSKLKKVGDYGDSSEVMSINYSSNKHIGINCDVFKKLDTGFCP